MLWRIRKVFPGAVQLGTCSQSAHPSVAEEGREAGFLSVFYSAGETEHFIEQFFIRLSTFNLICSC